MSEATEKISGDTEDTGDTKEKPSNESLSG